VLKHTLSTGGHEEKRNPIARLVSRYLFFQYVTRLHISIHNHFHLISFHPHLIARAPRHVNRREPRDIRGRDPAGELALCFGCNFQSKQSRPTTATRQQRTRKRQLTTFGQPLGLCTACSNHLGFTRSFSPPSGASHNLRAASKHNIAHT
jgi:hypothetical protein